MSCTVYAPLIEEVYIRYGSGMGNLNVWGLSRYDSNFVIEEFKTQYGVSHPCAGSEGNAGEAIDVLIDGQIYYGTPTYLVICPDYKMHFDICFPPEMECIDSYIQFCNMGLIADFSAEVNQVCQGSYIQFNNESYGNITNWDWQFEGGVPPTSNEMNPLIFYPEPGLWDVTLTVSNTLFTDTTIETDFVEIYANPVVTLQPIDTVCEYDPPFRLIGGYPSGGSYSGNGVQHGVFDPQAAGVGEHIITYIFEDENGCTGTDEQVLTVDVCAGINKLKISYADVYPNPSKGELFIRTKDTDCIIVQIIDLVGSVIISKTFYQSVWDYVSIDLSRLPSGFYMVIVNDGSTIYTTKISLLKE